MNLQLSPKLGITLAGVLALTVVCANADTFGSGANAFTIDFADIGNAGNADDAGAGGGLYFSTLGAVPYHFRMGVTEVPQDWITRATAGGLTNVIAGAWEGNRPAASMTWYEAAAFVNWLNETSGYHKAYDLNGAGTAYSLWSAAEAWDNDPGAGVDLNLFRHGDAHYFLPSEDEWYKSAYHKNDGVTANYWDYPTASNRRPSLELTGGTTPGSAVYRDMIAAPSGPAEVNLAGGLSAYWTIGQGGNVLEWLENGLFEPREGSTSRQFRGGAWEDDEHFLRSSGLGFDASRVPSNFIGFRVASGTRSVENVPEAGCTAVMLLLGVSLAFWIKARGAARVWKEPDVLFRADAGGQDRPGIGQALRSGAARGR